MERLDIGEVARRAGVTAATLRYYEELGLIASTGRHGLRRLFDVAVLERLALIGLGQVAGFSLAEIGHMFGPDGKLAVDRARLVAKADELDRTITRLGALRDGLRHAAACRAADHLACPKFQRIVRVAGQGDFARPGKAPSRPRPGALDNDPPPQARKGNHDEDNI
jgi:MerR family redox-sensitive transcriptional activator SoxR